MAQTVTPQCNEGYSGNQQQSDNNSTFVVVDQHPSERESFPYTLQTKWILGFSIFIYIFGTLLFITGIVNIVLVKYDTEIGFPIWCGFIVRTILKFFFSMPSLFCISREESKRNSNLVISYKTISILFFNKFVSLVHTGASIQPETHSLYHMF